MTYLRTHFFLIISLLVFSKPAFSQADTDSTTAAQYHLKGEELARLGNYDSSNYYFALSRDLHKELENWEKYLNSLNFMSQNNRDLAKFSEAMEIAEKALEEGKGYFPDGHREVAYSHYLIGILHYIEGYLDLALEDQLNCLEMRKEMFGEYHEDVGSSYNVLGIIYGAKSYFDNSVSSYEKALEVYDQVFDEDHRNYGNTYYNLGNVFYRSGNYDRSLEYHQKAQVHFIKNYGAKHPYVGFSDNSIGSVYMAKDEFDLAMDHYDKALTLRMEVLPENHPGIPQVHYNLGLLFNKMNDHEKSLDRFKNALELQMKPKDKDFKRIQDTYTYLGAAFMHLGQYDSAEYYIDKSIELKTKYLGELSDLLTISYSFLAEVYYRQRMSVEGLKASQKAIVANVIDFNDTSIYAHPVLENSLQQYDLLLVLDQKAAGLEMLFKQQGNINDLKYALSTQQVADTLSQNLLRSHLRANDQIKVGRAASKMYRNGVRVSNLLFELTDDSYYKELAFEFAEKSKASTLTQNLYTTYAKEFAGIPNELLELEKSQKIDQSYYLSEIIKMRSDPSNSDSIKLNTFQDKIFEINGRLDSLARVFERSYPNYFRLKYENTSLTVQELQSNLGTDQVFLEFLQSDSAMFALVVSSEEYWIEEFENDSLLSNSLDQFIASLDAESVTDVSVENLSDYTQSAHSLYKTLLDPIMTKLASSVNELIIVPSTKFSYIPWELFLTEGPGDKADFKSLDYLLRKYSVNYAYSANLLFKDIYSKTNSSRSVLAMAPSYPSNDYDDSQLSVVFRDALVPLKWNKTEIEEINDFFEGNFLSGNGATEKEFKDAAGQYRILHLAMHAFVDDQNPMKSKFMFYQDEDSTEDGMLHTYELYNMDLSAELAVLSGCNTGLGKIQEGEGIMSLGRAFSYAGCPAIIASHWAVDDKSTSVIMGSFYKFLSEGMPKHDALRLAKLDFLDGSVGIQSHPYYWGSFVALGDTSPISEDYNVWLYILVAMGVIAVIIIYMRNRERLQI